MNCPVCQKDIWLPSGKYFHWLKHQPDTPETQEVITPVPVEDTSYAKISPETGSILRRYKVWPNQDFYIDRDERTQSIWLDHGEWEYFKTHNLHDNIHLFFMPQWQKQLNDQELRASLEKRYIERFGQEDYARIKEIREWIYAHPHSNTLLAFLMDKDPYKA